MTCLASTRTGLLPTAPQLIQHTFALLLASQNRRAHLSLHRGQGCHFGQPRLFLLGSLLILEQADGLGYGNNPHCLPCRLSFPERSPPGLLRSRSLDQRCLFVFRCRLSSCCPLLLQVTFSKCCWGEGKARSGSIPETVIGEAPPARGWP